MTLQTDDSLPTFPQTDSPFSWQGRLSSSLMAYFNGLITRINSIIDFINTGEFPSIKVGDVDGGNYIEIDSSGDLTLHGTASLPP